MKSFISLLFFSSLFYIAKAQDIQIPNGKFDSFTYVHYYYYPAYYNVNSNTAANDTSDLNVYKVLGYKSNTSVLLKTKYQNSILTASFIRNQKGTSRGFALSQIPTTFHCDLKYNADTSDPAAINIRFMKNSRPFAQSNILFTGKKLNWIDTTFDLGTVNSTPDSVLITFYSSTSASPNFGNWLVVDNISFPDINYTIPNGNFESWTDVGRYDVLNWTTLNDYFGFSTNPYCNKTTDAIIDSTAIQIQTQQATLDNNNIEVISYITTGQFLESNIINNDLQNITYSGFAINSSPDSIRFYYKYNNPANTYDSALVILDFSKYYSNVHYNMGRFIIKLKPASVYTYQDIAIKPYNAALPSGIQADSVNIIISSSNYLSNTINLFASIGNTLKIDDMSFHYSHGVNLSGTVTYDNTAETPLSNITIILKNAENKNLDTTTTDNTGYYLFPSVLNGSYTLQPSTTKTSYFPNPTDALIINRSYIGVYKFKNAFDKVAADVNADGKVNPLDALLVNRHYIGSIKKFTIPSWLFNNTAITVSGTNVTNNIMGICAGDVTGAFTPK